MSDSAENLRKAAILIATLDRQSADALLAHVSPRQAQRVRRAVVELGPIDSVEQDNVVAQFVRVGPLMPEGQPAGIELDDSLAAKLNLKSLPALHSPRERKAHDRASTAATGEAPFRFLHEAECDELVHLLKREHPQTIAVVLAHLTTQQAASLVSALDDELRAEVLRRLAYLDDADPDIVREVEREIESWLHRRVASRAPQAGLGAVSQILNAAGNDIQRGVLSRWAREDCHLVERLSRRATPEPVHSRPAPASVSFDELASWTAEALAGLLAATQREVLVLALAGAKPRLVERVFAVLPADLAESISTELEQLGPTSLRDIELAQSELAALAAQLQDPSWQQEPALAGIR
jgi:flagellar motor switch protein FliG